MKLIDLSYHASYLECTAEEYLTRAKPNIGYAEHLKEQYKVLFVFHSGASDQLERNGVRYVFRRKRHNNRWILPLALSWKLKKEKPDFVLVHSLMYIHFAALLKLLIPSVKIFIQNHAEKVPRSWWKRKLVQFLDPYIDGYLFTSKALAAPWVNKKLFSTKEKMYEIMEGSSDFSPKETRESRAKLKLPEVKTFIWVGRLDANKDPICVLKALKRYASEGGDFRCYMFYQTEELLPQIQAFIVKHQLEDSIILKGYLPKAALEEWYNASDYYISASHYEGSGYALCEAMACNCIPIVTNIPSFRYMTDEGRAGLLFGKGEWEKLAELLMKTETLDKKEFHKKVRFIFENKLSFAAIAKRKHRIFSSEK